jgi:hypothetical protein
VGDNYQVIPARFGLGISGNRRAFVSTRMINHWAPEGPEPREIDHICWRFVWQKDARSGGLALRLAMDFFDLCVVILWVFLVFLVIPVLRR